MERPDFANMLRELAEKSDDTLKSYVIVVGEYRDANPDMLAWAQCPVYSVEQFIQHFAPKIEEPANA